MLAEDTTQSTVDRSSGTAPKLDMASTKNWAEGCRERTRAPIWRKEGSYPVFLSLATSCGLFMTPELVSQWTRHTRLYDTCRRTIPPQS